MKESWAAVALLAMSGPGYAQTAPVPAPAPNGLPVPAPAPAPADAAASSRIPDDLSLLAGKKVIVGRVPLCVPGTFNVNLTYAGKPATVVSFKPNAMFARMRINMGRIPANMRAGMEDARRGGLLTFKFEDGTVLDTCSDMTTVSQLAPNLQLAPGETVALPAATGATTAAAGPAAPPQPCPLTVTDLSSGLSFRHALVDALTTSELERQIDSAQNGGGKNYLDVRLRNDGQKAIKAFEYTAVYRNNMGDEMASGTYVSQNTQPIKPGAPTRAYTMDRAERSQTGTGDVKVYISRIRFDDDSMWEDNGSHSCFKTVVSK